MRWERKEVELIPLFSTLKRPVRLEYILFPVPLQWLPEKEKYLPPMTIHVKDNRAFGGQVLCGTHVIDTLHKYFMDPDLFEPRRPQDP